MQPRHGSVFRVSCMGFRVWVFGYRVWVFGLAKGRLKGKADLDLRPALDRRNHMPDNVCEEHHRRTCRMDPVATRLPRARFNIRDQYPGCGFKPRVHTKTPFTGCFVQTVHAGGLFTRSLRGLFLRCWRRPEHAGPRFGGESPASPVGMHVRHQVVTCVLRTE